MADVLKKLGDKASSYWDSLKSLPTEQSDAAKVINENLKQAQYVHDMDKPPAPEADRSQVTTQDKSPLSNYGSRPGEKRLDWAMKPIVPASTPAPVYDDGGEVDVNDGKHQTAILKDGERVLTPEENEQYKREHGAPAGFSGRVLANPDNVQPSDSEGTPKEQGYPGAKMNIDNAPMKTPEGDTSNPPAADVSPAQGREVSAQTKAKPYSQVLADKAEEKAKADAAEKVQSPGAQTDNPPAPAEGAPLQANGMPVEEKAKPTLGQSLAQDWLKKIGASQAPTTTQESTETQVQPNAQQGLKPLVAPAVQEQPAEQRQGSGLKPIVAQPPQAPLKVQLDTLKQQHTAALAERTPEGQEKADRIEAQIQDLQKTNPWGSAQNHPGVLGKLGHIASKVGNIAGDIVSPGAMEITPGTDLHNAVNRGATQSAIAKDTALATQRDTEANKADKGSDQWKLNSNVVGPNGRAVLENSKTGETKEAPEGYTAYDKPEHQGDQGTYIAQWYKDHPDAPKSTANDDKAIEAYGAAKAEAGQQNKAKGKIYYYDTPNGRQGYSYTEAQAAGMKPEDGYAVSTQQAEKDRKADDTYESLKGQLGQYKENIAKSAGKLLPSDVDNMSSIIESVESPDYVSKIASGALDDFYGKPVTGYNEKVMKGALTKTAYDNMSPAARQLVADYFTTLLAHFGNVKATLGQVPRNEKLITTEMNMIPKPYLNDQEAEPAFNNYTAQVERNNSHNVKFGAPKVAAPTGATDEVVKDGKIIGHVVAGPDGKKVYQALQQ